MFQTFLEGFEHYFWRLARSLGREESKVKEWQKLHSPTIYKRKPKLKLFSQHIQVMQKGKILKSKLKGCDPNCRSTELLLVCPSCKIWFWHLDCLKSLFEKGEIKIPSNFGVDADWNCIHCCGKQWVNANWLTGSIQNFNPGDLWFLFLLFLIDNPFQ